MSSNDWATDADILLLYPYFADPAPVGLALATRDFIRECTKCEFNTEIWGCNLKLGHLHYTAFFIQCSIAEAAATPGAPDIVAPLASVTEGPQSVSFGATGTMSNPADQFLMTRASGQKYLHLRDGLGPVPVALDENGCGSDSLGVFG